MYGEKRLKNIVGGGGNAADPSELDVEQFDIYDHLMTEEDI
jgi:hypothetical protein